MAAWTDELVPADLTYDNNGTPAPMREHPFFKEAPDASTFFKRAFDAHREVGSRIPVRIDKNNPTAIENWRKEHLPKLVDAGILPKPISDPKEYGITKPDDLHEGVNWDEGRATKFAQLGVKYNVPKEAMSEFIQLHREAVAGTADKLKTSYDDTMLELKREYGDQFDSRMEMVKRFNNYIFKDPEELAFMEETGLGNHPVLAKILMRLAPYAENDSSFVEELKQTGTASSDNTEAVRERIRAELADIYGNPQNPLHAKYLANDPEVERIIQEKYKAVFGEPKPIQLV